MRISRWYGAAFVVGVACAVVAAAAFGAGSTPRSAGADGAAVQNRLLGPMPTRQVELVVWGGTPASAAIDAAFMKKYPNVKVNRTDFDFATLATKMTTAVAARQGPDVLSQSYANPEWYKALVPMNGYLTPEMKKSIQYMDLFTAQDNGSVHNVPYQSYAYVWYYNKALFRRAGLNPQRPPTTYAQLSTACDRLKAAGITPIAAGFKDGWLASWYVDFGFASQLITSKQIRNFYNPNVPPNRKIAWTAPLFRTAVGYLDRLNKRGCFTRGSEGLIYTDMIPEFASKRAAMMYTVAGFPPFKDVVKEIPEADLGVFRMPKVPGTPYKNFPMDAGANTQLAITNFRSSMCRVAWEFVQWHYSPAMQRLLWKKAKVYPNLNAAWKPPLKSSIQAEAQVLTWLGNSENHGGFSPGVGGATDPVNRAWTELIAGQKTVDETLRGLEEERLRRAQIQPPVVYKKSPRCN